MKLIWMPFSLKPRSNPPEETGPRYADLYARGLAAAVDLILLFALFQRLFDALTRRIYASLNHDALTQLQTSQHPQEFFYFLMQSHLPQLWLLNTGAQVVLLGLVYVLCQWELDTTPGKWLMGLRIVDATSLEKPTKWQYALRFFAYIPATLPLMLGLIWVSLNKRRRGLHDIIAGTVVIHIHPRGWAWTQIKRGYRWLREKITTPTN